MKTTVTTELNDREKAALEIIADIDCTKVDCVFCPFYRRLSNATICIKNYVAEIVRRNNNDQSKH